MTICDEKAGKLSGPFESPDLFGAYDLKIPRTIASRHVRHYYDPSTTWRLARTVGSAGTTASVWRRLTRPVTKHTTTCSELLRSPLRPLLRPPRHGHDAFTFGQRQITSPSFCRALLALASPAWRVGAFHIQGVFHNTYWVGMFTGHQDTYYDNYDH